VSPARCQPGTKSNLFRGQVFDGRPSELLEVRIRLVSEERLGDSPDKSELAKYYCGDANRAATEIDLKVVGVRISSLLMNVVALKTVPA